MLGRTNSLVLMTSPLRCTGAAPASKSALLAQMSTGTVHGPLREWAMVVETKPNGIRTPVRIVVKLRTSMSKSSTTVDAGPPGMVVALPAAPPIKV
ncbi:hypothetical protein D3C73_1068470 [compost metagenome]